MNSYLQSLHNIRKAEFDNTFSKIAYLDANGKMIEIGSGTGYQLSLLSNIFKNPIGLDLANSNLTSMRVNNVIDYDGYNIPSKNDEVDYIFSSNTLEHIPHLDAFEQEMKRVVNKNGCCIHIVPTATWRFWVIALYYIALPKTILGYMNRKRENIQTNSGTTNEKGKSKLQMIGNLFFPGRHGERGNRFTEIYYLRVKWWDAHFKENGWKIAKDFSTGVFYTGHHLLGASLSIKMRIKLAKILGSACHTFILKK
jgi:ubiquinone/menaquinone biosynthesis C-methylase UbiE